MCGRDSRWIADHALRGIEVLIEWILIWVRSEGSLHLGGTVYGISCRARLQVCGGKEERNRDELRMYLGFAVRVFVYARPNKHLVFRSSKLPSNLIDSPDMLACVLALRSSCLLSGWSVDCLIV
jgi:hypothetical protein